jgi:hypothetical protein
MIEKGKTAPLFAVVISAILVTSFIVLTSQLEQKAVAQNKTSAAAANTTSGVGSKNATSGNQSSSSNPLAKIPIIGKLFGGK